MDLATVKATVKAWEKAFRADQGRAPTKEDIKADRGGIKAQYDLYRRLSKESQAGAGGAGAGASTSKLAQPIATDRSSVGKSNGSNGSSSSSAAGPSRGGGSSTTPRVVPDHEYPTTPTPNRRRRSSAGASTSTAAASSRTERGALQYGESDSKSNTKSDGGEPDSTSLRRATKRPAPPSSPDQASRTPSRSRAFITPKKPRPSYSGPIVDPNPINNPFASSSTSTSTFTATPPRLVPGGSSSLYPASATSNVVVSSPGKGSMFVHANSPRKLRELLESNSLRKVRGDRGPAGGSAGVGVGGAEREEITPRTKARLRLAGDFVTPMKDKAPRRRRGQRGMEGEDGLRSLGPVGGSASRAKGKEAMRLEDVSEGAEGSDDDEEGEMGGGEGQGEEEDEFGPSPMKPGLSRTFTELLQSVEKDESGVNDGMGRAGRMGGKGGKPKGKQKATNGVGRANGQRDIGSFFGKAKTKIASKAAEAATAASRPSQHRPQIVVSDVPATKATDDVAAPADEDEDDERLSTPPPPDAATLDSLDRSPPRSERKEKMVSFSDDEVDEWDPEGGNVRRKVFITGTKRSVARRGSLSSLSSASRDGPEAQDAESDDESDQDDPTAAVEEGHGDVEIVDEADSAPDLTNAGTTATPTHSSPRSSVHAPPLPPLLSLLSLRSPPARGPASRMNDLRVKAIFNPEDAARLRAVQKGQDIYVAGQGDAGEEGEDDLIDRFELEAEGGGDDGEEGDDDWDEDCEGWKRTGGGMDDEAW